MKLIPILFNGDMVRAINRNFKKQTRRTSRLINISSMATEIVRSTGCSWHARFRMPGDIERYEITNVIKCPYGEVGDVMWVRETFVSGYEMEDGCFIYDENGEHISKTWYRADGDNFRWYDGTSDFPTDNIPWKPSIHMPFDACRTFLKITDIRVERLQDISDADALDEGVKIFGDRWINEHFPLYAKAYAAWDPERHGNEGPKIPSPAERFRALWESINGIGSWAENPWVWVVSFDKTSKPGQTTGPESAL